MEKDRCTSVGDTVTFIEVSRSQNCVEASLAINPNCSWRPNPEKDKIKLVTAADDTVLNFLTPTIKWLVFLSVIL